MATRLSRRLRRKFGRWALKAPGRLAVEPMGWPAGFEPGDGAGFAPGAEALAPPERQEGSGGRRLRQSSQTPLSPGAGEYRAPQLEHPMTEAGVFMLRNLSDRE